MTWTNRVVWQEGMFLRAQHFQQQDRWLEALSRERTASLRPHPWGLVEMAVNRDLLATGRFALSQAAGVFEDGTPFSLPDEADHPPPLDLPESARNVLVYLALPVRQPGAVEIASEAGGEGRYALQPFEAYDTHSASPSRPMCRWGGCGCATCWRPTSGPGSCASGWRGWWRFRRTGG